MSKTNIKILLALLAVGMVVLVYFYVFKTNMDEKKSIEAENKTLETRLNELKEMEQHRDEYIAGTENYYAQFDEELENYPADLNQETTIMFMKTIENAQNSFIIDSAGLGAPEQFYTLTGTPAVPEGYVCYQAAFPIRYTGDYESIKTFIDYVMNYKYRMNVASLAIEYNIDTDTYSGSISLNAYAVAGGGREADSVDLDINNGVSNLFLGGADSATVSTYSYDTDHGASIADNNDIKITLNSADNDTAAGIVVSAGGSATNVTSSENAVEAVSLHIFEEDGKNYATYAIGDDEYTVELTGSDVKIYVASSERVGNNDTNGVKLNVTNDTKMIVFVKVDGDDSASPRFELGSKTGTVKVY